MRRFLLEMARFLPGRDRSIGIDIGSCSIKLAEFTCRQGTLALSKLKLQEINPQKDNQDCQLDALKNLFQDISTQNAKVNAVINCPQSCAKISVIPFMPKSEILQALKWEMRNFLSSPMDQAAIDYEILQEITEGNVKKLKVAVACCPQATVDKYLDLLSSVGIKPSLFTQHGFALKNVIHKLYPTENKTIAVLDIGYSFSELSIFIGNELVFSRKLPVAGQNFTQEMTQSLISDYGKTELTLEEAESIKKKYGIVNFKDSEVLEGRINSAQLFALLRPNIEKLITAIERSFVYYREKEKGCPVELLLLLGGGSNLKNLPKTLSETLQIPVQLCNLLAAFPSSESSLLNNAPETENMFASAIGAALASSHDINLLPIEIKQQTRILIKRSSIEAMVTAILVILILVYAGMRINLGNYEKRITTAETELVALSPQIEQIPGQVFIQSILAQQPYWGDALKEISNIIPAQIRLTEINAQRSTLTLKGQVKSSISTKENLLTEFMRTLEKGIFKEVNLISTKNLPEEKLSTFELRLELE
jgi:type IV pilus assembly protein PilM